MRYTEIVQNIKTHILYSTTFTGGRAIYEIMWKNVVEPDRDGMLFILMHIPFTLYYIKSGHLDIINI
jgi:hypothetical protein